MITPQAPKILVVDDEPQMCAVLSFTLETFGLPCRTVSSAEAALDLLRRESFDLVLADVMLPGASGIDLCRRVKAAGTTPVILLTALGETPDRIQGLEAGADDYIPKPFHPKEVVLRINNVLSRSNRHRADLVVVRDLCLDPTRMVATLRDVPLDLSIIEFRLLLYLAHHRNHPIGMDTLIRSVWSAEASPNDRGMVKTAVHRLRSKIEDDIRTPQYIVTVRGVGYVMRD